MKQVLWQLQIHGDGRERYWAERISKDFPAYEALWRDHIVPLTFRIREDKPFKYVRPTQPSEFLDLADTNYAAFYHLTAAHEWRDRILSYKPGTYPVPTECLYCFFSHVTSMIDAVLNFTDSINRILKRYDRAPAFNLEFRSRLDASARKYPTKLLGTAGGLALREFHRLVTNLTSYRNCLVHRRPVFVQNGLIPKSHKVGEYSGLTAICKVANAPDHTKRDFEPIADSLNAITREMRLSLEPIWRFAKTRLDQLGSDYSSDQIEIRGTDQRLSLESVRGVTNRGRVVEDGRDELGAFRPLRNDEH